MSRNQTATPIVDVLANRWSPRGFDTAHEIGDDEVAALIEAARWTPSANNTQPWRFAVAHRGTERFAEIAAALAGFNQSWAPASSVLVVAFAETERDGRPMRYAEYDLGQAVAHLSLQAESMGLNVHQMGGFDRDAIRLALEAPQSLTPMTVIAIGRHYEAADAAIRERDAAPRVRRPAWEITL